MNALQTKEVNFNGDQLIVIQNENGEIFTGVRFICNGIGLNKHQSDRQISNIQSDVVLSKGYSNLSIPTNGGYQESICIMLNFLPLWLAKISITPAMKKTNPVLVEKLINYQIKAKDVLAAAFLPQEVQPQQLNSYNILLGNLNENQKILICEQSKLNDKLNHHIQTYDSDKESLNNITLSIGYEINDIKKGVQNEIVARTSYIPMRPIVAKRSNTIDKARLKTIERFTKNCKDQELINEFTDRVNIIAANILKDRWTISKIKTEAEIKSNCFSGDNAFIHEICVYAYEFYKGMKISQ